MMDVASMLLAHTGEFKLTDPQVTRLAAIARRSADRRQAMMTSVDSLGASRGAEPSGGVRPAPGTGRSWTPPPGARALGETMRQQRHDDLREAIAVLTVEQQALGWEMMARRGGRGQMAMRGPRGRGTGMR